MKSLTQRTKYMMSAYQEAAATVELQSVIRAEQHKLWHDTEELLGIELLLSDALRIAGVIDELLYPD